MTTPEPCSTSTSPTHDAEAALAADARAGLTASPKCLPPKWFYDARGSELFEEITALPEYYPTRTERGPARRARRRDRRARPRGHARRAGLRLVGEDPAAARRVHAARAGCATFVPLDVSVSARAGGDGRARRRLPGARAARGGRRLHPAPVAAAPRRPGRRLVAFLGGTIGNLQPRDRAAFLTALRAVLEPGEHLLLGTDLVNDEAAMVAAYDDAAGRHGGVQPQRAARPQPGARRRLRRRRLRPRRAVGPASTSGSRCGCGRGAR